MEKRCIRILIVDDQPHVRKGLRALLETDERMHVIGFAVNGVQAICMAVEQQPDIILMDAYMPSLDGYEAARRIEEKIPSSRIILMDTKNDLSQAVDVFLTPHLYKNQSETALIELIEQVFDRKSSSNPGN